MAMVEIRVEENNLLHAHRRGGRFVGAVLTFWVSYSVLARRCGPNDTFAGWHSLHYMYAYAIQHLHGHSCQLLFTSPTYMYSAP